MDLYEYFYEKKRKRKLTLKEFAEKIGCAPNHLRDIMLYKKMPTYATALHIEETTNGVIKRFDLLHQCYEKIEKAREKKKLKKKENKKPPIMQSGESLPSQGTED